MDQRRVTPGGRGQPRWITPYPPLPLSRDPVRHGRGAEEPGQLTSSRKFELQEEEEEEVGRASGGVGMETHEILLFTFLASHYTFNWLFIAWIQSQIVPIDQTNYGLHN